MVKWQSFLDVERLEYVNRNCGQQIVEQMQTGVCPVRIDIAVGRKSNENDLEGAFYTFIGKDAIDSLEKYFEEERGWPKAREPIWLQLNRSTINKDAIGSMWLRLLRHMGKIPKHLGPVGSRYGYGMRLWSATKPPLGFTPTPRRTGSIWTVSSSIAAKSARLTR